MSEVVLDHGAVSDQLASVGGALAPLDAFFGKLAAIPMKYNSDVGMRMTDNGEQSNFQVNRQTANFWFYEEGGSPSDRQRMIEFVFSPFRAVNTDPNCVQRLGALSVLELEIRSNGGTATDFQRSTIVSTLEALHQWFNDQQESMASGFSMLNFAHAAIQKTSDDCKDDLSLARAWNETAWIDLFNDLIVAAQTVQVPLFTLADSWNTLAIMVNDVASHITGAALADVSSLLQQVDIASSMGAWPVLCDIATKLEPSASFTIPPPPPAFPA